MRGMIGVLASIALLGLPAAAAAADGDTAAEDPRWLPWIGCWQAEEESEEENLLVCVDDLADGEGVAITTFAAGEVVSREEILSDGRRVAVEEGGCEGEQWAEWSADGKRLFVHSEMACGEGVIRATRGVLSIQDSGRRWLEVHAVEAGDSEPVLGVSSFRPASEEVVARAGIRAGDEGRRLAVSTARTAAARALDPAAVTEVVHEAGPAVARAFIVEAGHEFALDAATLRSMKDDGVPEDVLDVMVAVSFPERFAIQGGSQDPEYLAADRPDAQSRAGSAGRRYGGYSAWDSFGYRGSYYGFSPFSRYGFGYSPYGYSGLGGYWGRSIVIIQPPTVQDRARVVQGRGYSSPGSSGRPARARGSQGQPAQGRSADVRPTRRESPPAATTGRTAPRVTPRGATSGGSGERKAKPRRPPGGGTL